MGFESLIKILSVRNGCSRRVANAEHSSSFGGTMPVQAHSKVNLKTVADRVGLAPCSVSAVLNNTPASRTIPRQTKERIYRAARELKYSPNFWARSLRTKRTRMVQVVAGDFGHPAVAKVMAGVQESLHRRDYLLVLGTMDATDSAELRAQLQNRGIEGVIAIDALMPGELDFPVAAVELSYLTAAHPIGSGIESWLKDLGTSAAEAIMADIEGKKPTKRSLLQTRIPSPRLEHSLEADQP